MLAQPCWLADLLSYYSFLLIFIRVVCLFQCFSQSIPVVRGQLGSHIQPGFKVWLVVVTLLVSRMVLVIRGCGRIINFKVCQFSHIVKLRFVQVISS